MAVGIANRGPEELPLWADMGRRSFLPKNIGSLRRATYGPGAVSHFRYVLRYLSSGQSSAHSVQIITDLRPYADATLDMQAAGASIRKQLPADLSSVPMPTAVRTVLVECWKYDPETRPDMAQCCDRLSDSTQSRATEPLRREEW